MLRSPPATPCPGRRVILGAFRRQRGATERDCPPTFPCIPARPPQRVDAAPDLLTGALPFLFRSAFQSNPTLQTAALVLYPLRICPTTQETAGSLPTNTRKQLRASIAKHPYPIYTATSTMASEITDHDQNASPSVHDDGNGTLGVGDSNRGTKRPRPAADDDDDDDDKPGRERRKIEIKFIQDKSRRHITFSKRKAGIMKKVCCRHFAHISSHPRL